ncbi:glutathione S-transferase N-terminal domain-containing protein [Novosphingopyxis sp.]|uniref:glutathione S-transferase N-terminal domain-containing protein n=1 Tax=Novosphingopyxis sp. TaxID=2709690 RepID=UPI003B58E6AD
MKLYGSSFSPFVRKVLVFCREAGIDHELVGIGRVSASVMFRRGAAKRPHHCD